MNIPLSSIDRENFMVHEHLLGDEKIYLVQPQHIGCAWSRENAVLRSVVLNSTGDVISASFKKFVNWGEKPGVFPVPTDIRTCKIIDKIDGSTLICSKYKGHYIFRTRGTVDARKIDNGYEIDFLLEKYPNIVKLLDADSDEVGTAHISLIFEWITPSNVIVLRYNTEPDLILTGCIEHSLYGYVSQQELDKLAEIAGFKRPKLYSFESMGELLEKLPSMSGIEGVCVYHSNDQEITKIKTAEYLKLHRFASNATLENTIDIFFEAGKPKYVQFEKYLTEKFDFECYSMVRGFVSEICDGYKEVEKITDGMKVFIGKITGFSRREQAQTILQAYGETSRSSMLFTLLDGKQLSSEQEKKLLYQCLKK